MKTSVRIYIVLKGNIHLSLVKLTTPFTDLEILTSSSVVFFQRLLKARKDLVLIYMLL